MPAKTFMSISRIKEIEGEIKEHVNMLKGKGASDGVGFFDHTKEQISDKGEILKEIGKRKKLLKDHTPFKLSAKDRDKASRAKKQCEKWIKENQPSYQEHRTFYPKGSGTPKSEQSFEQAVQHQVDWQLKSPQIVKTYNYVSRLLEPNNPSAGDLERLRRGR